MCGNHVAQAWTLQRCFLVSTGAQKPPVLRCFMVPKRRRVLEEASKVLEVEVLLELQRVGKAAA